MTKERKAKARILCVDDAEALVQGMRITLRKQFTVETATSGAEALGLLEREGGFAVLMSDMRMPGIDGAQLLREAKRISPNTVRILITGEADLAAIVTAVNECGIFRFLTKPCPPPALRSTCEAALEQHELLSAESTLLGGTLVETTKILSDLLALANPLAFGRASRVTQHCEEVIKRLSLANAWAIQVAAPLSQIGAMTLPTETIEKHYYGEELDARESQLIQQLPDVAARLLAGVPRLESVAALLHSLSSPADPKTAGATDRSQKLLSLAIAYDELEARGQAAEQALAELENHPSALDETLFSAFAETVLGVSGSSTRSLPFHAIQPGMILAQDIRTPSGTLLVCRGHQISQSLLEKLSEAVDDLGSSNIRVLCDGAAEGSAAA